MNDTEQRAWKHLVADRDLTIRLKAENAKLEAEVARLYERVRDLEIFMARMN